MTRLIPAASLLAASFCALTIGAASAADLPNRYAPAAPSSAPAPLFSWSGLYAGLNGQFAAGSATDGGAAIFGNPLGGLGGATVGYNYQSGRLLVGAEGDIAFGSLTAVGSFGGSSWGSSSITTIGTARVRAGYIWNDRALFYITGGYAGTSLSGKVVDYRAAPGLQLSESHYLNGYAVGGGIEYAITTKISVKGEYIFTGFNSTTYFSGTRDAFNGGVNVNLVRAGLNYHF